MKRKSLFYYIFLVLIAITAVLFFNKRQGTVKKGSHNFAPDEISDIFKVIISQRSDTITFEKSGDEWVLNNYIPARKELINIFLTSLQNIEAISPASKTVRSRMKEMLPVSGKKVQIFSKSHRTISYYVMFDTTGVRGTYMMLEKSHRPYLVQLNGYSGTNIDNLFSLDEKTWRRNAAFHFKPSEIGSVLVKYPNDLGNSFEINLTKEGVIELSGYHRIIPENNINIQDVKDYFSNFGNITYKYPDKTNPVVVAGKLPFAIVTVVDVQKHVATMQALRKPPVAGSKDQYDPDNFYGVIQSDTVIMKYTDIDPILLHLDDFQKK